MTDQTTNERYVVLPSTTASPSTLALAKRYSRVEDAVADMGNGVVVTADGSRLVAFHEDHLAWIERSGLAPRGHHDGILQ